MLPWTWQTDELSYMRKVCAVPVAIAAVLHVPARVVTPPDEVRKVAGSVIVASRPLGSAEPQLAGSAPLKIFNRPDAPTEVVIDEYVEIAKSFFNGPEAGFVNGALDAIARDERA